MYPAGDAAARRRAGRRVLTVPLVRDGRAGRRPRPGRGPRAVAAGLHSLPWEGLNLSHGDPAIPTRRSRRRADRHDAQE